MGKTKIISEEVKPSFQQLTLGRQKHRLVKTTAKDTKNFHLMLNALSDDSIKTEIDWLDAVVDYSKTFLSEKGLPTDHTIFFSKCNKTGESTRISQNEWERLRQGNQPREAMWLEVYLKKIGYLELDNEFFAAKLIGLHRSIHNPNHDKLQAISFAVSFTSNALKWFNLMDVEAEQARRGRTSRQSLVRSAVYAWLTVRGDNYTARQLWNFLPDREPEDANAGLYTIWRDGEHVLACTHGESDKLKSVKFRRFQDFVAAAKKERK